MAKGGDLLERAVLMGWGLVSRGRKEIKKAVDKAVKEGRLKRREGKRLFERVEEEGEEVGEMISERTAELLDKIGVVTQKDLDALGERLSHLESKAVSRRRTKAKRRKKKKIAPAGTVTE